MRCTVARAFVAVTALLLTSVSALGNLYSGPGNGFTVYSQPDARWLQSTYLNSITGPDYTVTSYLGPLWFSTGLTELSVPSTWPSWNCPPATESCTPRVVATSGDSLTITMGPSYPDTKIFGFELQPNSTQVDEVVAQFFSGSTLLGTIDQFVDGNGGAAFFGAIRTSFVYGANGQRNGGMPFTSVQITDLSGNSFALANLRDAPEPSALLILGSGLLVMVGAMRQKLRRLDAGALRQANRNSASCPVC